VIAVIGAAIALAGVALVVSGGARERFTRSEWSERTAWATTPGRARVYGAYLVVFGCVFAAFGLAVIH
jgi:drug/metabolite transporter (DMT)-like permease